MLKTSFRIFITLLLACFINAVHAEDADKTKVKNAYTDWCTAISEAKGNPAVITKFYAPGAILLPTLSPKILINHHGGFNTYFKKLTQQRQIKCTPEKLITQMDSKIAVNSGLYDFSYTEQDGKTKTIPARFTFVYKQIGDKWLIIEHHSSMLPADTEM